MVYVFSSENWCCLEVEVFVLMNLFLEVLVDEVLDLYQNGICLCFIGDLLVFSFELQVKMLEVVCLIEKNIGMVFVVVVNYGGYWDIINVCKQLVVLVQDGCFFVKNIGFELLQLYMLLGDLLLLDLCICIGGE